MGHGMLGETKPGRNVWEHLMPAPVERSLEQRGVCQAREDERGNADHDERPEKQREHPDGGAGKGCRPVERDVMRGGGGWDREGEGDSERAHRCFRSRLTLFAYLASSSSSSCFRPSIKLSSAG